MRESRFRRALTSRVLRLLVVVVAAAAHSGAAGSSIAARGSSPAGRVPTQSLAPAVEGQILGIDGRALNPFAPAGPASVIFFVATDCPISNSYAPEIQRVCADYGLRGVTCALIYEDVDTDPSGTHLDDEVRHHLREYRYTNVRAAIDRSRAMARRANATVTPQAVVIDRAGEIRYRGRIDNFYAALGKPRQQVTERDLRAALDAVLSGQPVPRAETQALGCYIVDPDVVRKK